MSKAPIFYAHDTKRVKIKKYLMANPKATLKRASVVCGVDYGYVKWIASDDNLPHKGKLHSWKITETRLARDLIDKGVMVKHVAAIFGVTNSALTCAMTERGLSSAAVRLRCPECYAQGYKKFLADGYKDEDNIWSDVSVLRSRWGGNPVCLCGRCGHKYRSASKIAHDQWEKLYCIPEKQNG